jgi:hypothetical protein
MIYSRAAGSAKFDKDQKGIVVSIDAAMAGVFARRSSSLSVSQRASTCRREKRESRSLAISSTKA